MFSELVDTAVHTAGRPDAVADIARILNEVMRNLSKRSDFDDDAVEEVVYVSGTRGSVVWTPSVGRSRMRREEFIIDGCGCTPVRVKPSRRIQTVPGPYYYQSGDSYVFDRCCNPLRIFYYAYQPWLLYFAKGSRPAQFDIEQGQFMTGTAPATEADIAKVSNWMLERHNSYLLHMTLNQFFASKQDPRQSAHYAIAEKEFADIVRGEGTAELKARYR